MKAARARTLFAALDAALRALAQPPTRLALFLRRLADRCAARARGDPERAQGP